jgi:TadE-like protein
LTLEWAGGASRAAPPVKACKHLLRRKATAMDRVPASHPPAASPARRRWRGQGVVEFALILPVMLLVMFVLIELARLLHAWLAVENGARFGVRYAVTGEYNLSLCVDSDVSGTACDSILERDNARLPSIINAARAGSVAILRSASAAPATRGYFKVTICSNRTGYTYWPADSNTFTAASCAPLDDPGGPGDRVSVTVDFDHPLIVPVLSQWFPVLHLTAKRRPSPSRPSPPRLRPPRRRLPSRPLPPRPRRRPPRR